MTHLLTSRASQAVTTTFAVATAVVSTSNQVVFCQQAVQVAERELMAFVAAIDRRFGPEPARQAAEDWLETLESLGEFGPETIPDFRQCTIAAANKFAGRILTMPPKPAAGVQSTIHNFASILTEEW